LQYQKGQLVRHPTLGIGKVLVVDGNRVTVFFKDQKENPSRTIVAERLEIAEVQSDPWLDNLDLELAISGHLRTYLTHEGAIEKFLRKYPQDSLRIRRRPIGRTSVATNGKPTSRGTSYSTALPSKSCSKAENTWRS
jgi:hypothetical protein